MRRMVFVALSVAVFLCANCNRATSVTAPSNYSNSSNNVVAGVRANWSPYIVVHTSGEALAAYQKAIPELVAAGALRGVRIGITKGEGKNSVNEWIASAVPDVLWVLDNYYLFEPNIEGVIDQVFNWYPSIRYLQIGNEVTTILPKPGPQITVEEYMTIFKRVYNHVQKNHPNRVMLVVQPTIGSGKSGAQEIERMIELGLKEMPPDKIILSFNCYTAIAASEYTNILNSSLRDYRVWVTETGIADYNEHISFVANEYPRLKHYLRFEIMFWYALWVGDEEYGSDTGFGLIRNLRDFPRQDYWRSPLFKVLTGEN